MKEIKIGNVDIKTPLGLAPMAGVTDIVFRNICKEMGAGLTVTEMVSAKAIVYRNKNTGQLLKTGDKESPVAVQLFGGDASSVREAIEIINDEPFDILDFNMGCPVPKVVKNKEGSALMLDPKKAEEILKVMAITSKKPVTVKMRSGFDEKNINAPLIAKIAEDAGVSAVTVHGRTREQYYSGTADWDVIRKVKETVSIPVFGNGDVKDGTLALEIMRQTGCDGVMIGRAAMGNPWIFREILHFFETGEEVKRPSKEEVFEMILRHAKELADEKGEIVAIREMRSHAAWYTHGFKGASAIRRRINEILTLAELEELFS